MLGVSYGMGGAKMARSLNLPTRWAHIIPPTEPGGKSIWKDIGPAKVESIRTEGGTCVELAGEETQRMLDQVRTATPYIFELAKLRKTKANAQGFVTTGLGRRCRFLGFEGNYEFTHKALNRCIQGDAAEMTKVAMLKLWRQGVCPNITLHDELIFNIKDVLEINILKNTMENAIKTHVPMVVSVGVGPNWGAIGK
jgi:DNA polymerase I-like protein with 3'-5' exonuclease and polymerase domains